MHAPKLVLLAYVRVPRPVQRAVPHSVLYGAGSAAAEGAEAGHEVEAAPEAEVVRPVAVAAAA
ncbi:MAG: hypothetical protein AAFN74_04670 [Myxococcota bacterium]